MICWLTPMKGWADGFYPYSQNPEKADVIHGSSVSIDSRNYNSEHETIYRYTLKCGESVFGASWKHASYHNITNDKNVGMNYYYEAWGYKYLYVYNHSDKLTHNVSPITFKVSWWGSTSNEDSDYWTTYNYVATINYDESAWGVDGNNHRTYCKGCGGWIQAHNKYANTSYVADNGTTHHKKCNIDGLTFDTENHTWSGYYNDTATCTAAGTRQRKCTLCNYVETTTSPAKGHVESGWGVDGDNHRTYCTRSGCGAWINAHNKNSNYYWITDGSTHKKHCNIDGIEFDSGSHYDNNSDGKCDACGRDIQGPTIVRTTYVAYSDGYYVYSYVTDNSGSVAKVAYPSWTSYNGQDDLQSNWWDTALGTAGSWTINGQTYNNRYFVEDTEHNNEPGPYTTHVYAYDAMGNYNAVSAGGAIYLVYAVTYIDMVQNSTTELGRTTMLKSYSSTVSGSDLGMNTTLGKYYTNYIYASSTSATVTTSGATVYRYFKLGTTGITFNDNGGSGGPGTVAWIIGSVQHPTSPTRKGYNFKCWTTAQDGTGSTWPSDDVVSTANSTYYAQWVPSMYTIVLEPNNT